MTRNFRGGLSKWVDVIAFVMKIRRINLIVYHVTKSSGNRHTGLNGESVKPIPAARKFIIRFSIDCLFVQGCMLYFMLAWRFKTVFEVFPAALIQLHTPECILNIGTRRDPNVRFEQDWSSSLSSTPSLWRQSVSDWGLFFIDNSIANISLYALSWILNTSYLWLVLSHFWNNFWSSKTREFRLFDASCKIWQTKWSHFPGDLLLFFPSNDEYSGCLIVCFYPREKCIWEEKEMYS